MIRLLLFGDSVWAAESLRRLVADGFPVSAVVLRASPTDSTLDRAARELRIPVEKPPDVNDPEFVSSVSDLRPDLGVSISYDQILRPRILKAAALGFVNFHAGKLPFYRGRNAINWAVINGESEIGLTAHYVDKGIDTGDIILQRTLPIGWEDTYGTVLERTTEALPNLVSEVAHLIGSGTASRQPQAHLQGTYFCKRQEGDEWLDWSDTSHNIYNKIRAITDPGPGARTVLGEKVVMVWGACFDPEWPEYMATPGQVVGVRPGEGVAVKTGDSTLLLREVEVAGEERHVPAWPIGTRLGINLMSYLSVLQARLTRLEQSIERFNR